MSARRREGQESRVGPGFSRSRGAESDWRRAGRTGVWGEGGSRSWRKVNLRCLLDTQVGMLSRQLGVRGKSRARGRRKS